MVENVVWPGVSGRKEGKTWMKKAETERVNVIACVTPPPLAIMIKLVVVGNWPSATKSFSIEEAFPPDEGVTGFTVNALDIPGREFRPCSVRLTGDLNP